jgi:hypothetical protein
LDERRAALARARSDLTMRRDQIIASPQTVLSPPQALRETAAEAPVDDRISQADLT